MQYDPALYATVTSTLYKYFGIVGSATQIGALAATATLTILLRGVVGFRLTLFGTVGLALSLILWFALVSPVNAEWSEALNADPASAPEAYERLRSRWEWGHVAAFTAWFAGFCLLLLSVVMATTPARRQGKIP